MVRAWIHPYKISRAWFEILNVWLEQFSTVMAADGGAEEGIPSIAIEEDGL